MAKDKCILISEIMKKKKVIINYIKEWDKEGTSYDQTFRIRRAYLNKINNAIDVFLANKDNNQYELFYLHKLHLGTNYTTLTTSRFVAKIMNCKYLKRNTIIAIY